MIETGYLYPAPNSVFDMHYSIRTEKHYFAARDNSVLEIVTNDRNADHPGDEVDERLLLSGVRAGHAAPGEGWTADPIANLTDNAEAVALDRGSVCHVAAARAATGRRMNRGL